MTDAPKQPNILWLCTDQQRWDTLGVYGNTFVDTPNIDQLARDGVVFEHCYAQSPVCTPSRASFLTGRYPRTNRCRQNGQSLPDDEVLVTKLLADNRGPDGTPIRPAPHSGYVGGLSGKFHLAPCHPSVSPGTEARHDDGYSAFHWSHHPAADWPTNEYAQWLDAQGITLEQTPFQGSRHVYTTATPETSQTAWCADKAIDFIERNQDGESPWFFSVNFYDPHHAFDPPLAYLERYAPLLDTIPQPNYVEGELDDKPVFQQIDHRNAYNTPGLYPFVEMDERDHATIRAAYWAMVDQIDAHVGRIMAALRASGQLENTLVIFTSDHGEMLGDHGIYLKGPYFYDPAVRVPLIVSWPGTIEGGRRSNALVELLDLAPTLLEAAGLESYAGMQGRSLLPLLRGEAPLHEHAPDVYCEYLNAMPWHSAPAPYATMLRTYEFKIVSMHGLDGGELYDLSNDPDETVNCWYDPAYRDVRLEMLKRLVDRIALTADPLPERVAPW